MFLFCKGALFQGKGGPPVLEKPARHLPRQGRGFARPPVESCFLLEQLKATKVYSFNCTVIDIESSDNQQGYTFIHFMRDILA